MSHRAPEPPTRGWMGWLREHWQRGGTTEDGDDKAAHSMVGRRARTALLTLIAVVWTIQFLAGLFKGIDPDPTVNYAFLLVAGAVFGVEAIKSRNGGSGGGPGE